MAMREWAGMLSEGGLLFLEGLSETYLTLILTLILTLTLTLTLILILILTLTLTLTLIGA